MFTSTSPGRALDKCSDTPVETWEPFYDSFPEYFEGQFFRNNLGSFVFTSGDKRILADTGYGPHGEMLGYPAPGELIADFKMNGIGLDSITDVFLTHLHGDHVGWNLREDLPDRPLSFPKARYRVHEADWKHFTTDALDLMDGETELAPGVTAFPTPGHMSLLIASRNERALLVGDLLGSPMQATETDFHYSPDLDGPMGIAARRDILDRAEREGALVIGSHFSYPGWGAIIRWEGRRYWKAL